MARSAFGPVFVGWLCATGAAFVALFGIDVADDYAWWIPLMVAVQVPALLALRPGPREAPLSGERRWGLALPAGLIAGVGAFWTAGTIGCLIWKPVFLEFRPLLLALGAGLAAVIAAGIAFSRMLRRDPHPRGARRVLVAVTAIGAAGVLAMALPSGRAARPPDAAAWIGIAMPVLWVIPLWLLLALEPPPEPPIPRASVRSDRDAP